MMTPLPKCSTSSLPPYAPSAQGSKEERGKKGLQFYTAFAGRAELERCLSVLVGDKEVAKDDDIHANEHVDVFEIALHNLNAGHKVARGNKHVDKIDIRTCGTAYTRDSTLLVGLQVQLLNDAR